MEFVRSVLDDDDDDDDCRSCAAVHVCLQAIQSALVGSRPFAVFTRNSVAVARCGEPLMNADGASVSVVALMLAVRYMTLVVIDYHDLLAQVGLYRRAMTADICGLA